MPPSGLLRRLLLAALLPLAAAAPARAQDARPDITGDSLRIDLETRHAVYSGRVRAVHRNLVLTADELRYDNATNEVEAVGHVVLLRGARRLLADRGTYNFTTQRMRVTNLRLGEFPFYLSGESAEGTLDELTLVNAQVFFREDAAFTPSFSARRLTYAEGRIVTADEVRVGLLGGRFLPLPKIEHRLDADFISYVTGKVGYRRSLGAILQAGAHLPVAPGVELGGDVGLYTARGLMFGPSGSYRRQSADGYVAGDFRSGYISDHGDRKTDFLGRPVPAGRKFAEWRHDQRVGDHLSLRGQLSYWSDSEVLRDFRPKEFTPIQQPDSFLEAAYARGDVVVSALLRAHPNRYHRIQERLPELRVDVLPAPLLLGAWQRAAGSFAVLEEDAWLNLPGLRSTRLDAYYGLIRPVSPAPWLTVVPVAGGRVTRYADLLDGRSHYLRSIGEVGVDARVLASGTFDYRNETWDIDGLRHLVEPVVSYRYAPRANRGRPFIPAIDRRTFSTYLPPLGLADARDVDDLRRLDTLRIGLNNTLQTRDRTYGSRDLVRLDLAADYWFTRAENGLGRKGLADVHTALAVTPAPWLRLEAYHRLDPHRGSGHEFNTALELIDQEWWSVKLATHFLKGDYEEYSLDYRQRLNEVWDLVGRWRYDARRSRLNEQSYGVWQRLGQTWAVKYEVAFYDGPRRESSFGFNVEVELLKF